MKKNTIHVNRGGLRATRVLGSLIIGLSLIFLSSCENFMNGSDLREELDATIEYANAPYANIQILSDPDAKYTIIPSEGVYDKSYKAGDKIELDFTARSSFQFVKWSCEPEGAVDFGNARDSKTTATVKKDDVKIKIQPKTEKRPVVTISPSGTEEKARNIAIVVSFDREMELTSEDLNRIEITSGGEDLKKHYKTPEITNKTTVTFAADISNLVPVESTRTINVTVPEDFYSLADDGTEIYLEKKVENNFKINHNTLIKADIKIEKDAEACDLKGSSSNSYYVDDQIHVVCVPTEAYRITGWSITDDEENDIENLESILKIEISEGKSELSAKVLLGTEENKKIVIKPVCVLRDKLKVAFKSEVGTLTPATGTEKSYYIGDSFTATVKFPETHEFSGWKIYDKEQYGKNNLVEVLTAVEIEEKDEVLSTTKTAVFTVIDDTKSVVILPDLSLRKTITISFKADKGNTTPSDSKTLYSGDSFDLRYSDISDYAFTNWKLYDKNNASRSVENLLEFDAARQETTVRVKELTEDRTVVLEAEFAKRPKVVSSTPSIVTGSVQRDRTIVVMFDKRMHPSSIYFNKNELIDVGVYDEEGNLNSKYETLGTAPDRIYGYYEKGDKEGSSYVYKNIRITRNGNEDINLLKYYDEPTFDKNNAATLRIPTKITELDDHGKIKPDYDFAPPKNIGILVTLGTGMQYEVREDVYVGLYAEESWPYLTNQSTDAEPPEFVDIQIRTSDSDADEISDVKADLTRYYYSENTEDSNINRNVAITNSVENIKNYNVNTGCIWIKGSTKDSGSGTASLEAYFVKKHDPYYPNPDGQDIAIETPVFLELTEGSSTEISDFNQMIDLSEMGLSEGVYTISFVAADANSHYTYSDCSYQFVYDVKGPNVKEFEHHRKVADKVNFLWENTSISDFDRVEITTKNETVTAADMNNTFGNNLISSVSGNQNGYELELSGLSDETNYSHTLKFYDLAGNMTEIPVEKDTDSPAAISGFERTRNTSGKARLFWDNPAEEDFSKVKIKYQIDEEDSDDTEHEIFYDKSDNLKALPNLTDYKHYKYTATVVDFAGNESAPVTIKDDTDAPAAIVKGKIRNVRNSADKEEISWENPDDSDLGKTVIEIYDGDVLKESFDMPKITLTKQFEGLEDRKQYTYKLRTLDYSGNESAVVEWKDDVGPASSSLITRDTIKNTRTSADKETLSWTNPTALENSYYIVEQYSPSGALVSSKEVTRSESSKLFDNMSRGKYKYRFYSVDYANNKSSNYTEWQDDVLPTATVNDISNSRTSADKETISWTNPTGAAFDDVDYMQIDQYDGTSLKNSYTWTPSSPATSKLFTSLTGGTKYTYKFSCVDYAGNKIAATTDWQDNVRPTALVTKSTISGSRPAASNETVRWSNPTGDGADEVSHIIIKQYYSLTGTVLQSTFTQSDKTILSNNFTGLTNQRKYEYRFYSVDYNGNVSSNYTKYEDTTGPAPVSGLYSDAGQYRVSLHFTTPSTEDFDHIEVYKNSSTTKEKLYADKARKTLASPTAKSTEYMVRPDSYAGSSDTWKVYAVDFAGNKSTVSQITEGYAKPGMIVYQITEKGEPIVSSNWYGNFKCVGVLYTVDDYINVARTASRKGNYVWDITEYLDIFIWGKNDWPQYDDTKQHDDGKRDYEMIVSKYRDQCVDYRDSRNPYNQTVWQYLEQTRNYNNKLTWWLPAIDDYKTIIKYMDDIDAGINFIRSNGGSVDFVKNQWYASSSVGNGHDSHRACYYQLRNNSFANKSHGYTDDTWKDLPGHSMWHFMTEVPLD